MRRRSVLGALLLSIVAVSCGGGGGAETGASSPEAADPGAVESGGPASDIAEPVLEAAYYLPVYSGGVEHVGVSPDRVADATRDLDLWRQIEFRQPEDHAVGERDFTDASASLQDSTGMSDEEFAEMLREVEEEVAEVLGLDASEEPAAVFAPIYGEWSSLCGEGAMVSLYAASAAGEQPALEQYREVTAVEPTDLPTHVGQAWQIEPGLVPGYAWQPADHPEILVVVSPVEHCEPDEVFAHVTVERGE